MDFSGPGKIKGAPWEGPRIIALRRELGQNQTDFARRIRVRLKTLQLWESGRGRASEWAVPQLIKLEKRIGKSQEMMQARKKGAIVRYVDGKAVTVMPRQRKRQTVTALGSTQGRMADARVALVKANIKNSGFKTTDRTSDARIALLKANLKNSGVKTTNRTADARVELLKRMMRMDAAMKEAPRVNPRVKLLRQMLKTRSRQVA